VQNGFAFSKIGKLKNILSFVRGYAVAKESFLYFGV
jgi:hypothetical protein